MTPPTPGTTPPTPSPDARAVAEGRVVEGRVVEPVDVLRTAVLAVPGVAGLHGGPFGAVATHLPGRRVAGVVLRGSGTEVHVVVEVGADIRATAARVHEAVAALATAPTPVHVYVEDLAVPT